MLELQRAAGNRIVAAAVAPRAPTTPSPVRRCACGGVIGPTGECSACAARRARGQDSRSKVEVGPSSGLAEASAERLALAALRPGAPPEPRSAPASEPTDVVEDPATVAGVRALRRGGQPLPPSELEFFEERFGGDLGGVRVHTDPEAQRTARGLGAEAFTSGQHIAFGAGRYTPGTPVGRTLLAHELAHVVQGVQHVARQAEEGALERATGGLIVEDGVAARPEQQPKSAFLEKLREAICQVTDEALSATGRSTDGCPYLAHWFAFYRRRSAADIERVIRSYAPEAANATRASDLIGPVLARVRAAVETWAATGQITGVPPDLQLAVRNGVAEVDAQQQAVQTKQQHEGGPGIGALPGGLRMRLGEGEPLAGGVRGRMERALGHDLSGVRMHTGPVAAQASQSLDARAFAFGNHVVLDRGEYRPGTPVGDALLAHELAHVVQQRSAGEHASTGSAPGALLEMDATEAAAGAVASLWGGANVPAAPRRRSGLALQRCGRTVKECPPGTHWGLAAAPAAAGPVCVCTWRCLPGAAPRPRSSVPAVSCSGPGCPTPPRIEIVGEEHQFHGEGSITGVGAHMSPLTGGAACGCLRLTIEGAPVGNETVSAPLTAPGISLTDLAAGAGRGRPGAGQTGTGRPTTVIVGPRTAGARGGRTTTPPTTPAVTPGSTPPLTPTRPTTPAATQTPAAPPAPAPVPPVTLPPVPAGGGPPGGGGGPSGPGTRQVTITTETIVDTSLAIALDRRARGLSLSPGHQAALAQIAPVAADPRRGVAVTPETVRELGGQGGLAAATANVVAGVPVTPAQRTDIFGRFTAVGIRQADAEVATSAALAQTSAGVTPRLAITDGSFLNKLARLGGIDPARDYGRYRNLAEYLWHVRGADSLTITVEGRPLTIVPIQEVRPSP